MKTLAPAVAFSPRMKTLAPALALLACLTTTTSAQEGDGLPGAPRVPSSSVAPTTTRAELRGHVDLQAHPAMHMAWPTFFREGMLDAAPTNMTWRHQFTQQVYTPFMKRSGVRLFGAAAMAAERADEPGQAHRLILDQLEQVERWIAAHPADMALARTPQEARRLLTTTDKMVVVHQIEGGRKILLDPRDAWFWRSKGVMLVTVMHLLHDELGHAAFNLGPMSGIINVLWNGIDCRPADARRGLTARGREAIVELHRAGILVDLSHMHPTTVDDALEVCRQHSIPPIVTHGMYKAIQDSERGLTAAQIVEIYRLGGMVSVPCDGNALDPHQARIPVPAGLERGTMDMYRFHVETVHRLLRDNAQTILGKPWAQASDAERTRLAVGWASDWNGWTNHSRPTPRRAVRGPVLEVDRVGLAHPGLLPQYFQRLREDGMDLDPVERSLERFIQIWEQVRRQARLQPR